MHMVLVSINYRFFDYFINLQVYIYIYVYLWFGLLVLKTSAQPLSQSLWHFAVKDRAESFAQHC